ncbi:hypothetical protein [Pseudobutyrivibrio xylanivorans]|uniref:Uncharacterized protein n=1 Tax=Pseudobutyrivibrio xylanivorans TaxID=185007 RepID=A0A1G5S0S8_PSEXY|nr:hypothetical protein [Pseudobutyrivibrio xylanivorans]SCZ79341.1 hypothetical protein SAMN02910350_01746 [Pseudobutyrivibrio xylanivorans]
MITVRTRRKLGMTQQQLGGFKEEAFIVSLGQNFIDFVDKYSEKGQCEESLLYDKMNEYVKAKDYKNIEKLFSTIQVFGTYDKVTQFTTKYKTVKSSIGHAYNGTLLEGGAEEKAELDRIVAHTCGMCSAQGDEFLGKLLA